MDKKMVRSSFVSGAPGNMLWRPEALPDHLLIDFYLGSIRFYKQLSDVIDVGRNSGDGTESMSTAPQHARLFAGESPKAPG